MGNKCGNSIEQETEMKPTNPVMYRVIHGGYKPGALAKAREARAEEARAEEARAQEAGKTPISRPKPRQVTAGRNTVRVRLGDHKGWEKAYSSPRRMEIGVTVVLETVDELEETMDPSVAEGPSI